MEKLSPQTSGNHCGMSEDLQDVSGNFGAHTPVYYLRFIQIVSKGGTVEN